MSDSLGIMDRMSFPIYFGLGETYMELRDFDLSDHFYRLAEKELDSRNLSEKFTFAIAGKLLLLQGRIRGGASLVLESP